MSKRLKQSIVVFVVIVAAAQLVRPGRANPPIEVSRTIQAHVSTSSGLAAILDRSCRDCHSNDTRWPWYSRVAPISWFLLNHVNGGRDRLNYSRWTSYESDDQDKFLNGICSMTKKGRMPLPSYLWVHSDARLSDADVKTLCAWSDKMRDTLQ